ncbi:prepilin-type N-terminal cleavage/methylation domain-containing protein [Roseateles koreensis]|uniref:Prepilin-type N-terminal cleavage/methylation domain-containing protein n=1 Tax=Roseateles koreensis TaxID=2987526 RepID=A0ABT5KRA8_9BURK|nr:prepilin-type N-terminal cleavage/methylation domain-containing protein [Roseateles koreensis]MDC8785460.1 prepilin-type N-terminal cleavage/methylation domain-containing protein [Roseateles koreensis]
MAENIRQRRAPSQEAGFTLVEVLVALLVMAIMAMVSWQGLDALVKSRDIAQTHLEQSMRLLTVMAQWEQDMHSVQASNGVDALSFDGASLRLTRHQPGGLQVVAWTVRSGSLYRWEGPTVQTLAALEESYQRSQLQVNQDASQLLALPGVAGWQLYYYRGNSWSNAQSSDNLQESAGSNSDNKQRTALPTGVRVVLQFAPASGFAGPLTRQITLGM